MDKTFVTVKNSFLEIESEVMKIKLEKQKV